MSDGRKNRNIDTSGIIQQGSNDFLQCGCFSGGKACTNVDVWCLLSDAVRGWNVQRWGIGTNCEGRRKALEYFGNISWHAERDWTLRRVEIDGKAEIF